MPLLPELLRLAAENGRARGAKEIERLECEIDHLQEALRDQARHEARRRLEAKLTALAELAAGAGHEINNPLAVISGQAQYLLNHEREWFTADVEGKTTKALHTIIAQTKRVQAVVTVGQGDEPSVVWLDVELGEELRIATSFSDLLGRLRPESDFLEEDEKPSQH